MSSLKISLRITTVILFTALFMVVGAKSALAQKSDGATLVRLVSAQVVTGTQVTTPTTTAAPTATIPITSATAVLTNTTAPLADTTVFTEVLTGTVVNANNLNVRSGPGLQYPVFATLTRGQSVDLVGRDTLGAWLQVRLADGRSGWSSSQYLVSNAVLGGLPVAGVAPSTGVGGQAQGPVTNANNLRVRSGPGLNFDVLTTLPLSTTIVLEGRDANGLWLQVRLADGQVGWVSSAFMTTNVNVTNLPVITSAPAAGVGGLAQGAVFNANTLNVRAGPALTFDVLATLPLGADVVLEGRDANALWLQVRLADGRLGWVSSAFITANLDLTTLPVTG